MADNSTLSPGAGSTVSGSTTNSAGGTGFGSSAGSSNFSDTSRPTGSTTTSSTQGSSGSFTSSGTDFQPDTNYRETQNYGSETGNYQPSGNQPTFSEQSRSRPSTAVIAGAAVAGAIAGGAIPFFFAGRKSTPEARFSVDGDRGDDFEGRESRPALFSKAGIGKRR